MLYEDKNGEKMKKSILLICIMVLAGCASVFEAMPGFTHTSSLMLGSPKSKVVASASHTLGNPLTTLQDKDKKVHIYRYTFAGGEDIVLYFNEGKFVKLTLVDTASSNYPDLSLHQFEKLYGFNITKKGPDSEPKLQFIVKEGQNL